MSNQSCMRKRRLCTALLLAALLSASAQQLSQADQVIMDAARARYYSLQEKGFVSLACTVHFDAATVPLLPMLGAPAQDLLKATAVRLTLNDHGGTTSVAYPDGTTEAAKQQIAPVINVLNSLLTGLYQTWPSKGLFGPIPPFSNSVERVTPASQGYLFSLHVPGAPATLSTDKNYLATEIVSAGGTIHEHPTYTPTPDGLVYAGNDAVQSTPDNPVVVHYEQQNSVIDGLRLPSGGRLRVNSNIDLRFTLENCSVKKATVVRVGPPK
ncbi:hypothetical protein GCM10022270_10820 [Terriglobus aquaticus]